MTALARLRRQAKNAYDLADVRLHQWRHDRTGRVELIHINKTGGSSVENALGLPFAHYTAQMRIDRLGVEEWNRRYSFTFVRNPWDRLVSQYHHRLGRNRLRGELEFAEWLRRTLVDRDPDLIHQPQSFIPQLDWITSTSGAVVVDDVFRFEALAEGFASVCGRLGRTASLPHAKPSRHQHYSSYYDATTVDIVGRVYERDVQHFGYRFDRPSTGGS